MLLRRQKIEHPTSNAEHRTRRAVMPRWEFVVGCFRDDWLELRRAAKHPSQPRFQPSRIRPRPHPRVKPTGIWGVPPPTFQHYTHLHHAGVLQQCGAYFENGENHIRGGAAAEQWSSPPVWGTGSGPG